MSDGSSDVCSSDLPSFHPRAIWREAGCALWRISREWTKRKHDYGRGNTGHQPTDQAAPPVHAPLALYELHLRVHIADERLGHIQRPPAPVLGAIRRNYDHAWLMLPRFPDWATIPGHYSLAMSRRWHLAFALIFLASLLLYLLWSLLNRHFSRDLSVRREDDRPSHIWRDIKDHALLRFQVGEAARHYNVLQKLSYEIRSEEQTSELQSLMR